MFVLVSTASRKIARNILFCLDIYSNLTGQKPNLTNSTLYLPTWCNRRLAASIASILKINQGQFPFIYLGIPISPEKLSFS